MPRKWLFIDYVHATLLVGIAAACVYAFEQGTAMTWLRAFVGLATNAAQRLGLHT